MAASQSASGMQVFNIDGYGLHKGLGVGKFIRSTAFTVGGYDWCIRYYPDGDPDGAGAEESKEYFAVFLELLTKNAEVTASYRFSLEILVRATWQSPLVFSRMKPLVFNSVSPTWGDPKFWKWRQLEESHGNNMVHIRIVCDVTVIRETRVEETALAFVVQVPPSDLLDNLRDLLNDKEGQPDVTFKFKEGKSIPAHKVVLRMRSPVFKAKPKTWWQNKTIDIDMQRDVFKALLHFIYTDSLPSMDHLDGDKRKEMFTDLLEAANRYAMARMKMMCAANLCKNLNVETVVTTFALADEHQCSQLKDGCVQFIASSNRMDDIVATQGYVSLKSSCPAVLIDMLEKVTLAK